MQQFAVSWGDYLAISVISRSEIPEHGHRTYQREITNETKVSPETVIQPKLNNRRLGFGM
jgi:hypothetical protein